MARRNSIWSNLIDVSGLSDAEKLELRQITNSELEDEWLILGTLFRAMDPSPYVLFLGDGEWVLVTPWGCQGSSFSKYNRYTGERLAFVNELMPSRFEISDKELRNFFCMLELSLFKLLELHEVASIAGKDFDKLTLGGLRKVLRKSGLLSEVALDALDKIVETRNEFNHSMIDVHDIGYCGKKLEASHSSRYVHWTKQDSSVQRFFIDDAFLVTEEIIGAYRTVQHKTMNGEILLSFMRGNLGLPTIHGNLLWQHRDCALEEKCWFEHQAEMDE